MNYCRQITKQFGGLIADKDFDPEMRSVLSNVVDLCNASTKFLLPEGGRLIDDTEYRALDESEELKLPFPFIALEYHRDDEDKPLETGQVVTTKAVVFARERDDVIVITPVVFYDEAGFWAPMPEAAIPKTGYLDRTVVVEGYTAVKVYLADNRLNIKDYADEVYALMCFLNALQCANVKTQSIPPRKAKKKAKSALPFDTYHMLTIDLGPRDSAQRGEDYTHRSPREHLRRGHVRRYESGLRIWVNATVVNAGRGFARVKKDYRMKCSGQHFYSN